VHICQEGGPARNDIVVVYSLNSAYTTPPAAAPGVPSQAFEPGPLWRDKQDACEANEGPVSGGASRLPRSNRTYL